MIDVYIISYKNCNNTCQKKLKKLQKKLKKYNFQNIYVCSGNEDTSNLNVEWNKDNKHYYIWTTHKAAILRYLNTKSNNHLMIIEDDVEFLHSPQIFNMYLNNIFDQLKNRDWKMIMLGGSPLGLSIPISNNIVISQSPRSAQCILYNKKYVTELSSKQFFRYNYGEGWYSLPLRKRLISNPILTTQNVLPQEVPNFVRYLNKNYNIPFKIFHKVIFYATIFFSLTFLILISLLFFIKINRCYILLLLTNILILFSYILDNSTFYLDHKNFPKINKKNNNIIIQEFCP